MDLWVCHAGRMEYREALRLQHRLRAARQAELIPDTLLLLEHDPVYTRGRRATPEELPLGAEWYAAKGIDIVDVDRGGKVTYHGPGQLVGYPIVRVGSGVLGFVRTLEEAIVAALADEGVDAHGRMDDGRDFTGAWVGDRKIGSIGLHVNKGVTTHGFAVNVDGSLEPWSWIVPCGLPEAHMTSILEQTGRADPTCFRKRMAHALAQALGTRQRLVTPARLERELAEPRPVISSATS
ncbi:MAG TPA: lipoyl(octanoyl) transferase LipB [Solirubrobacteraceae bacterium]|nr:lipoyl(octanoyl) transferase LipB [Solirubrobacteraceae bacterium]